MNARPRKEIDTSTYEGRFAARLKMLREKAGLSVEDVAETLDVRAITVYQWEQGRSSPQVSMFPALAELFNFSRIRDILPEK